MKRKNNNNNLISLIYVYQLANNYVNYFIKASVNYIFTCLAVVFFLLAQFLLLLLKLI